MNLEDILLRGTRAAQPLATSVADGTLYYVTDQFVLEQSNGVTWLTYSGSSSNVGSISSNGLLALDGRDGEESFIPGPQGLIGPIGPAGSAASAAWALIGSSAASGAAVDFINLSAYNELLVFLKGVTGDSSCIRQLLVSTDNGSTFLNTSGNYVDIDGSGAETNGTVLSLHNTPSASARSMWGILNAFNMGTSYKFWQAGFPTTNLVSYVNTLTALNAIRVRPHTGNFTGGTIYVLGR